MPDQSSGAEPDYCAHTSYEEGDGTGDEGLPATGDGTTGVERAVWDALREVEDPEMPVSVVDLGLIYGVEVADGEATVRMTLTYTGCPARDMLTADVREAAASPDGVDTATVELVWSPPWNLALVTDSGRAALREFGVSI